MELCNFSVFTTTTTAATITTTLTTSFVFVAQFILCSIHILYLKNILVISNGSLRLCVGEKVIKLIFKKIPGYIIYQALFYCIILSTNVQCIFIVHVNKHGIVFIPGCLLLKITENTKISLLQNINFPEL